MRQLLTEEDAVEAEGQHTTPCSDCPWARTALPGWLGGGTVDEWVRAGHSPHAINCHVLKGAQCAGAAIYRSNVCQSVNRGVLKLPKDTETVFSFGEFRIHHTLKGKT